MPTEPLKSEAKYKLHKSEKRGSYLVPKSKAKALNKAKEYTGKKGEYSKSKQGNFMKVHPLDRI